jgi:hypothetical protein
MADPFACEAEHLKIYLWAKSQLLQGPTITGITWKIGNMELSTSFRRQFLFYSHFFFSAMAINSYKTDCAPQEAADAVFFPTQDHGFDN